MSVQNKADSETWANQQQWHPHRPEVSSRDRSDATVIETGSLSHFGFLDLDQAPQCAAQLAQFGLGSGITEFPALCRMEKSCMSLFFPGVHATHSRIPVIGA